MIHGLSARQSVRYFKRSGGKGVGPRGVLRSRSVDIGSTQEDLGSFSSCSSVVYIKNTPSSQNKIRLEPKNPLKLCDRVLNIYY